MSKKNKGRVRSQAELNAIKKYYAGKQNENNKTPAFKGANVGKVFRGKTKYIDLETKPERNYVVVRDNGKDVTIAKLKSIKNVDEYGKNVDKALVEINAERYGLEKRTGVDFQRFDINRMSKKPLSLKDKDVFPEEKERFILSNRDRDKALFHTGVRKRNKKRSN